MITVNDWIATTPFPEHEVKTTVRRGVALIDQTIKLTKLTVVFEGVFNDGKGNVQTGDVIYVSGDAMKHQWAGQVYDSDNGEKFILIPRSIVVAVERRA